MEEEGQPCREMVKGSSEEEGERKLSRDRKGNRRGEKTDVVKGATE